MLNNFSFELNTALNAAKLAAQFCEYLIKTSTCLNEVRKFDNSPVTIADYGAELLIKSIISKNHPTDLLISEEDLNILKQPNFVIFKNAIQQNLSKFNIRFNKLVDDMIKIRNDKIINSIERYWVIDPLDGTKGFINNRQYAIAIALIENGSPKLGVLACPQIHKITNENSCNIFFAEKDKGAYACSASDINKLKKLSVNTIESVKNIIYTESYEKGHACASFHRKVAMHLKMHRPPIKIDSQCKYALLANGMVSAYFRFPKSTVHKEYIWDHAAGISILEEAGGKVTDILGNSIIFSGQTKLYDNIGIVASNKTLHSQIIHACKNLHFPI